MNTNEVGATIIEQLGGNRIFAMAFKAPAVVGEDDATLRIATALVRGTVGKATHLQVKLSSDDTYTVTLTRVTKTWDVIEVAATAGVHADALKGTVESMTGLRLSL